MLVDDATNSDFILEAIKDYSGNLDEAIDSEGTTLLILAVKMCRISVVELLLKRSADVNKPDFYGNTPLDYAFLTGFTNCYASLIEFGANEQIENTDSKLDRDLSHQPLI